MFWESIFIYVTKKNQKRKKKDRTQFDQCPEDPVDSIHHGSIHKKREALLVLRAKQGIRHILLNVAAVRNAQVCFWHDSFLVCMVVFFFSDSLGVFLLASTFCTKKLSLTFT